jgi:hypothetical protein
MAMGPWIGRYSPFPVGARKNSLDHHPGILYQHFLISHKNLEALPPLPKNLKLLHGEAREQLCFRLQQYAARLLGNIMI